MVWCSYLDQNTPPLTDAIESHELEASIRATRYHTSWGCRVPHGLVVVILPRGVVASLSVVIIPLPTTTLKATNNIMTMGMVVMLGRKQGEESASPPKHWILTLQALILVFFSTHQLQNPRLVHCHRFEGSRNNLRYLHRIVPRKCNANVAKMAPYH
jgi:hypothetical protein